MFNYFKFIINIESHFNKILDKLNKFDKVLTIFLDNVKLKHDQSPTKDLLIDINSKLDIILSKSSIGNINSNDFIKNKQSDKVYIPSIETDTMKIESKRNIAYSDLDLDILTKLDKTKKEK